MSEETELRNQLVALLNGGQAHTDLTASLEGFPFELTGEKPHGLPYSGWQLLEHLRFTLADLLRYCTESNYQAPQWPDDYWPKEAKPASKEAWDESVAALHRDLQAFVELVSDEKSNLYDTIPWADEKHNLLREVLVAADHNSYHIGELIVLRRLLGVWKK